MAGLVPGIHVFGFDAHRKDVDARDERGHDEDRSPDGAERNPGRYRRLAAILD
jgi:hypothetical protein